MEGGRQREGEIEGWREGEMTQQGREGRWDGWRKGGTERWMYIYVHVECRLR